MLTKLSIVTFLSLAAAGTAFVVPQENDAPIAVYNRSVGLLPRSSFTLSHGQSMPNEIAAAEITDASKSLRTAETEDERATAEVKLRAALSRDYDLKMKSYEAHLKKLEKELQAMKDRLSRRRAAKDEMVDLRVKVLKAEADDLGWPSDMTPRSNSYSFGYSSQTAPMQVYSNGSVPSQKGIIRVDDKQLQPVYNSGQN